MSTNSLLPQVFMCFPSQNRQSVAEPIAYHLFNYGINVWYDREQSLLGDNLRKTSIQQGVEKSCYTVLIISRHTAESPCQLSEIESIKLQYEAGKLALFPLLYELKAEGLPHELAWVKDLIYREITRSSGSREVCNHVACKVTEDLVAALKPMSIEDMSKTKHPALSVAKELAASYLAIGHDNLNARVAMLYALHLAITPNVKPESPYVQLAAKVFGRLFSETKLHLDIDYREIWLLENSIRLEFSQLTER